MDCLRTFIYTRCEVLYYGNIICLNSVRTSCSTVQYYVCCICLLLGSMNTLIDYDNLCKRLLMNVRLPETPQLANLVYLITNTS